MNKHIQRISREKEKRKRKIGRKEIGKRRTGAGRRNKIYLHAFAILKLLIS
jgi:hypothetical protein